VSGPFPDTLPNPLNAQAPFPTTIERLINGVVVGFHRVQPSHPSTDVGVWTDASRSIPLYTE
jgi:hypothetical protein